ncbi:hypothetical protein [Actinophytocola sp.]|uniref:hypothetical protein n=1 Tax=Actinophytocola sp. TaxID=1872138 RepID=UPI0038999BC1
MSVASDLIQAFTAVLTLVIAFMEYRLSRAHRLHLAEQASGPAASPPAVTPPPGPAPRWPANPAISPAPWQAPTQAYQPPRLGQPPAQRSSARTGWLALLYGLLIGLLLGAIHASAAGMTGQIVASLLLVSVTAAIWLVIHLRADERWSRRLRQMLSLTAAAAMGALIAGLLS